MGIKFYTYSFLLAATLLFSTNSFATTPITYGDDLTGWINTLGESHDYTFQGTAGDRIFIRVRGTSGGVDGCIELFDPSGASVAMDCDDGGYVTIDGHELASTGTYTIHAKDHDDNDTGFYGLSLQIVNNTNYTTSIDCQFDILGELTHQAEIDAFSYTASAGDVIVARMRSEDGSIESRIRIYDPAGNLIEEGNSSGGTTRINTFSIPADGTYTILAYDGNGNDTGNYGFSFQVINPTACAENIECGTVSADLNIIAEMHAYAFNANVGDLININMRGGAGVEAELELYNAAGVEIANDNPNGGTAKIEDFSIPTTGTYFIMARDRKGNDIGNYGLSFYNMNNLDCATELNCNTDITTSIDGLSESDYYYFQATAGERVMVQMRATSNSLEGELSLYNSDGFLVAEDSPGGGLCEIVDLVIPSNGTYLIKVNDKHGNDTGDYGLSFQKLDLNCTNEFMCADGAITSNFNNFAQMDAYHFEGTVGDVIKIKMVETGTELEPLLYVYDPNHNRIIDETASHDINVSNFELTETGTYIAIAMDRNGNDLGGYTLNIECAFDEEDTTPPVIAGCDDATFSCTEISGGAAPAPPSPITMTGGGYNMTITFDNSVEVIAGTCIFGDMTIIDNGCNGIRTACYGNTLQFTPDYNTCGGPFPALPFTIDFGNGLVATFDVGGNATIDAYPGAGGSSPVDEWLNAVTALDNNGAVTLTNDFDPAGFSCNGGTSGTQVVTFTAIDDNNNVSTCQSTITVSDDAAPDFDSQPTYIGDINSGDNLPQQEILTATDACGNATVTSSIDPYEVSSCGDYEITYRWTATDECGNISQVTRSFNVYFDSDNLSQYCPEDLTIVLGEEGFVQLDGASLWGFENECNYEFFSADDLYFDCTDVGTHPISFSVMSNNQVLTVCNFNITIDGSNCQSSNGPDYCESNGDSNGWGWQWIQSISLNTYTSWTGSDNGYGDYTGEIIDVAFPSAATIELDPTHDWSNYKWAVWIDYNQDGVFTDDEKAFSANGKSTLNGTIDIPATALAGTTRMRVSMKRGSAPQPCSIYDTGEVEDYTINFVGTSNFGGPPPNSNGPQSNNQMQQSQPYIETYPNPALDYIMVDMSMFANQMGTINIHNSWGMQVWTSGTMELTNTAYQVDISSLDLPAGIYNVSVIHGKSSASSTIYVNNE